MHVFLSIESFILSVFVPLVYTATSKLMNYSSYQHAMQADLSSYHCTPVGSLYYITI